MKCIFNLITIISMMSLFFCSCNKNNSKVEAYAYRTPEFENKSKTLKYNLKDAVNIHFKYALYELGEDSVSFYVNLIYADNYIFSHLPYNLKTGVSELDGVWVNGNTGEIKVVKEGRSLELDISGFRPIRPLDVFRMTKENLESINETTLSDETT